MTKFSDIPNSFSFQRAKIGENCKVTKKSLRLRRLFFCDFNGHHSSTTKFFTSHVAEASKLLVYLNAMVTL